MLLPLLLAVSLPAQDSFSVILIPDTQNYSETGSLAPIFLAQTQWVTDHRVDEGIAFVTHVGDIVQHGAQGANGNLVEWNRADTAMDLLDGNLVLEPEGVVPYSAAIGNHDFDVVSSKASGGIRYRDFFGSDRYLGSWYLGASVDGLNHAQRFTTAEGAWLHLALEWRPSDRALAFAQEQIAAHPGVPVLVTTHEHMGPGIPGAWRNGGATPDGAGDNDGRQVYAKLVVPNPEVMLVLCGHVQGSGYRTDGNAFGRPVHQVLMDFQFEPNGGNGWMTRIGFDPDRGQLHFDTLSPTYVLGVTQGLDRSTDRLANFDLDYDAYGHREELESFTILRLRAGQDLGAGIWNGAQDSYIGNGNGGNTFPDTAYGAATEVRCDGDADQEQGLLAFHGLVGTGAAQIPAGATVERALLTLTTEGSAADSSDGGTLHRMLVDWDEQSTWNSLGDGVQLGTEARTAIDMNSLGVVGSKGTRTFDVTAAVQSWVDGEPNRGWLVRAGGTDRWSFRSSEWLEVMERPLLTIQYRPACPAPVAYCPTAANSTGQAGVLQIHGSTSVSANDMTLAALGLPPGQPTVFVAGTERARVPLGDGNLCVGGTLLRLAAPSTVDLLGQTSLPLDWTTGPLAGGVVPGSTWTFQAWHRDLTSAGSNLTGALEVVFCE